LTPPVRRIYRITQPRWVQEYALFRFPDRPTRPACPLGPIPEALVKEYGLSKAIRAYRPYRPEVDLLVVGDKEIIIIEADIRNLYGAVGKLVLYRSLVPLTPELRHYKDWPVRAVFLTPKAHLPLREVAKIHDVEIDEWAPTWVLERWQETQLYWTREAHELRERRKEVLRRLGFE